MAQLIKLKHMTLSITLRCVHGHCPYHQSCLPVLVINELQSHYNQHIYHVLFTITSYQNSSNRPPCFMYARCTSCPKYLQIHTVFIIHIHKCVNVPSWYHQKHLIEIIPKDVTEFSSKTEHCE